MQKWVEIEIHFFGEKNENVNQTQFFHKKYQPALFKSSVQDQRNTKTVFVISLSTDAQCWRSSMQYCQPQAFRKYEPSLSKL